jgi:hypothetical protein
VKITDKWLKNMDFLFCKEKARRIATGKVNSQEE